MFNGLFERVRPRRGSKSHEQLTRGVDMFVRSRKLKKPMAPDSEISR